LCKPQEAINVCEGTIANVVLYRKAADKKTLKIIIIQTRKSLLLRVWSLKENYTNYCFDPSHQALFLHETKSILSVFVQKLRFVSIETFRRFDD